jgi:hypothetical protein
MRRVLFNIQGHVNIPEDWVSVLDRGEEHAHGNIVCYKTPNNDLIYLAVGIRRDTPGCSVHYTISPNGLTKMGLLDISYEFNDFVE